MDQIDATVAFNPFEPGYAEDPYAQFAALRAADPVHASPLGIWMLFAYDDIHRLLRAGRLRRRCGRCPRRGRFGRIGAGSGGEGLARRGGDVGIAARGARRSGQRDDYDHDDPPQHVPEATGQSLRTDGTPRARP